MDNQVINAPPTYEQVCMENTANNEEIDSITLVSNFSISNGYINNKKTSRFEFLFEVFKEWKNYNLSKILIFSLLISWIEIINQYYFQIYYITTSVIGINFLLLSLLIISFFKRSKEGIGYLKILLVIFTYIGTFITINTLSKMLKKSDD